MCVSVAQSTCAEAEGVARAAFTVPSRAQLRSCHVALTPRYPTHTPSHPPAVEGWIVFVTGVHEEASEDDVLDKFAEYGTVRSINLNLDRRTGFAKGYALIEYGSRKEAEGAIAGMDAQALLGKEVRVSWAFVNEQAAVERAGGGGGGGGGSGRRGGGGGGGGGGGRR